MRILYSNKMAVTTASSARLPSLTVQNITRQILTHLTVAECEAFSYLSIESELVIMVVPTVSTPSKLQVREITPSRTSCSIRTTFLNLGWINLQGVNGVLPGG